MERVGLDGDCQLRLRSGTWALSLGSMNWKILEGSVYSTAGRVSTGQALGSGLGRLSTGYFAGGTKAWR